MLCLEFRGFEGLPDRNDDPFWSQSANNGISQLIDSLRSVLDIVVVGKKILQNKVMRQQENVLNGVAVTSSAIIDQHFRIFVASFCPLLAAGNVIVRCALLSQVSVHARYLQDQPPQWGVQLALLCWIINVLIGTRCTAIGKETQVEHFDLLLRWKQTCDFTKVCLTRRCEILKESVFVEVLTVFGHDVVCQLFLGAEPIQCCFEAWNELTNWSPSKLTVQSIVCATKIWCWKFDHQEMARPTKISGLRSGHRRKKCDWFVVYGFVRFVSLQLFPKMRVSNKATVEVTVQQFLLRADSLARANPNAQVESPWVHASCKSHNPNPTPFFTNKVKLVRLPFHLLDIPTCMEASSKSLFCFLNPFEHHKREQEFVLTDSCSAFWTCWCVCLNSPGQKNRFWDQRKLAQILMLMASVDDLVSHGCYSKVLVSWAEIPLSSSHE